MVNPTERSANGSDSIGTWRVRSFVHHNAHTNGERLGEPQNRGSPDSLTDVSSARAVFLPRLVGHDEANEAAGNEAIGRD
jgi:hypothetical protein